MRTVEIARANRPLASYVPAAGRPPLILTRRGRAVAALVPIHDADAESVALAGSPRFQRLIRDSRNRLRKRGGVSPAEMRRRLGL